jgi:hypothetical protein
MSVFQLLQCEIALGGDILNVVARHSGIPITYPELLVLRYLHGQNAVNEIFDAGAVERDDDYEMQRLTETYGYDTVRDKLFPGAGTRLPNGDNRFKPKLVIPDKPLAATAPPPETTHEPGRIDYDAQSRDPGASFTPSAEPVQDDPFGDATTRTTGGTFDGPTSPPTDAADAEAPAPDAETAQVAPTSPDVLPRPVGFGPRPPGRRPNRIE